MFLLRGSTLIHAHYFQAMVIVNGYLYVFGGTTGYLYSTDLHRLDLSTREWSHLKPNNAPSDLPAERSVCVRVQAATCSTLMLQDITEDGNNTFSGTDMSWLMTDREYTF